MPFKASFDGIYLHERKLFIDDFNGSKYIVKKYISILKHIKLMYVYPKTLYSMMLNRFWFT